MTDKYRSTSTDIHERRHIVRMDPKQVEHALLEAAYVHLGIPLDASTDKTKVHITSVKEGSLQHFAGYAAQVEIVQLLPERSDAT